MNDYLVLSSSWFRSHFLSVLLLLLLVADYFRFHPFSPFPFDTHLAIVASTYIVCFDMQCALSSSSLIHAIFDRSL